MRAIYEFLSRKSSSGRIGEVVPYSDTGGGCFAGAKKKGPWSIKHYLDLSGFTWIFLDLPGFNWIYLYLPGFNWV